MPPPGVVQHGNLHQKPRALFWCLYDSPCDFGKSWPPIKPSVFPLWNRDDSTYCITSGRLSEAVDTKHGNTHQSGNTQPTCNSSLILLLFVVPFSEYISTKLCLASAMYTVGKQHWMSVPALWSLFRNHNARLRTDAMVGMWTTGYASWYWCSLANSSIYRCFPLPSTRACVFRWLSTCHLSKGSQEGDDWEIARWGVFKEDWWADPPWSSSEEVGGRAPKMLWWQSCVQLCRWRLTSCYHLL